MYVRLRAPEYACGRDNTLFAMKDNEHGHDMQTDAFRENVEEVAALAGEMRCALMCAESVPWRCHRSMVADALLVRGIPVEHIINPGKRRAHTLTPFAKVEGTRILYPPEVEGEAD